MPEIQACPDEIRRGLKLLFRHGDVVELRVPKTPRDGTISGYFNGSEALIKCAIELDRRIIPAQYVTLNELDPALLARSANRVKTRADVTTSDGNIRRRRWLLVDLDSRRPAGVSASDVEHQAALDRARTGRDGLAAEGWPMPILADSGNGSHLLYRIDLPNDPTVTQLVTKCLKAISQRYGDAQVSIDETVGNPARITKLYGTPARKGDDTPERPHRLSQILEAPETCAVVPEDLLVKLAAEVTDPVRPAVAGKGSGFQVEDWIARHGLKVRRGPLPWEGRGEKWELEVCPFDEEHTGGCAVITRGHDGRIGFRCQHNSCSGKGWCELRELLDGPHDLRMRWGLSDEDPKHQVARAEVVVDDWPNPEPIQSELPPVPAFSEDLLPVPLRPLVRDMAERMQVPLDYPAVISVLCLAGAVNRRAVIQPKANDTGWVVVPNLWGGIIAPPGFMKSPVIQAVTRPLNQIQAELRKQHVESLAEYTHEKEECELRRAAWREQFKASAKGRKAAPERPEDQPEEPTLKRLIVNDATFEALHQTMSENPAGVLVIRDELTGWLSRLDQEQYGTERGFALQAWNGDSPYDVIRIGRGSIHVEGCCMSVLGGIQPSRLRSYLVDALEDGPSNDGLIQRFQLLVWSDTEPEWTYVDRAPDAASEEQAARVFRKLVALDPANPARFRFAPDAQELFMEWLAELEAKVRRGELHSALISHLSKYRSLMPSLALHFELAERASFVGFEGSSLANSTNFVSLGHTRQAAAWCDDYLEPHARRVYSCIVTPQLRAARELAGKIKKRKVGTDGFFSCRDVYLKGWSGLDTPEAAKLAADVLQDARWIKPLANESGLAGGRPATRYQVNPRVWE